jgi:predicted dithiol-disulfide oxidoreductase (DUF899 family)
MCTTLLDAWEGVAPHLQQCAALAVVACSPVERLAAFKRERGWRSCRSTRRQANSFNANSRGGSHKEGGRPPLPQIG